MQLTGKQAAKLVARYNAGMNDPMTKHYHAGEFVSQSFRDSLRRMKLCIEDVHDLAEKYWSQQRAKRQAHRNPARLRWKADQSYKRWCLRL